MKVNSQTLAAAGITGSLAVVIMIAIILFVLGLNLCIFAVVGVLFAYLWNTFVVPNVGAELPTLLWWQAGLVLMALRVFMGIITPSRT
jgi:hypothetical protein